jgi:hypothetical protein
MVRSASRKGSHLITLRFLILRPLRRPFSCRKACNTRSQGYLASLNYAGPSGIGYQELTELKEMAERNVLANDIIGKANGLIR